MTRPVLRLIADDLTGALDSAAELAEVTGPVPVRWAAAAATGSLALDAGTREAGREEAFARLAALAPALAGADIAFKKVDSLLRGQLAAELAALLSVGEWPYVALAPAFPAQGRVTSRGIQFARGAGETWSRVGQPIAGMLAAEGLACRTAQPGDPVLPGITLFDAGTEADMVRIVAAGRAAPGPVLWCGSGGLARALAAGDPARRFATLRAPVLGLFGSDQAVTARQLAACGDAALCIAGAAEAPRVAAALAGRGAALVSLFLPPGLGREDAAARIRDEFAALTQALAPPATLLVAGGETLRGLCDALGAEALEATGLVLPGVPRSIMRAGRWDGVPVISKSGAFGTDGIWRDLLAANGFFPDTRIA